MIDIIEIIYHCSKRATRLSLMLLPFLRDSSGSKHWWGEGTLCQWTRLGENWQSSGCGGRGEKGWWRNWWIKWKWAFAFRRARLLWTRCFKRSMQMQVMKPRELWTSPSRQAINCFTYWSILINLYFLLTDQILLTGTFKWNPGERWNCALNQLERHREGEDWN